MDLVTREGLLGLLKRFGIEYSDRALQHALKHMGLKPAAYQGQPGGKGRIALYDPFDAWVIATAYHGREASWTSEHTRVDSAVAMYEYARKIEGAACIPDFTEDERYGLGVMYLTAQRGGMPVEKLFELLERDPDLIEQTMHGSQALHTILKAYTRTLGSILASRPLPTEANYEYQNRDDRDRYYTEELISWAGGNLRMLNTTD